jgi:hypothetical protein
MKLVARQVQSDAVAISSRRRESIQYTATGNNDILVLPDSDREPTHISEPRNGFAISFSITSQFWLPICSIGYRYLAMLRTRVPETAIEEDGDPSSSKCDVRHHGSSLIDTDGMVHSKSSSGPVKSRPQPHLWACVLTRSGSHSEACCRGRWVWIFHVRKASLR